MQLQICTKESNTGYFNKKLEYRAITYIFYHKNIAKMKVKL